MGWALLERLGAPCWEDIVGLSERTGIQVDGSSVVEVNCHLGQLVLLGSRTSNIAINQELKLLRAQCWGELKRSTEERLGDGERGIRHCE